MWSTRPGGPVSEPLQSLSARWVIVSGPEAGYWVGERLGRGYFAERSNALGLAREGVLVAGVIYENWNRTSICCHIVAEAPVNRPFMWAICDYAFNVCGVKKVIASIEDTNLKSIRFVTKMGFVEEARIRDAHPGGDMLVFTLVKPDCRFLKVRREQISTRTTACA